MTNYPNVAGQTAEGYKCKRCGASGVKLWRPYQSFDVELLCVDCACKEADPPIDPATVGDDGYRMETRKDKKIPGHPRECTLDWYVPAIPSPPVVGFEDSAAYWGYCAVPQEDIEWWKGIPTRKANNAQVPA